MIVAELAVTPEGLVRFSTNPNRGVFRIEMTDVLIFKFQRSLFQTIDKKLSLVNISGERVFHILPDPTASTWSTTFLTSHPWSPNCPGPYRINSIPLDDYSQSVVECTVIVNPQPPIPLQSIRMLTVMPRRIGRLSEWPKILEEIIYKKHYNAIHSTPMQKLGPSNSSYSLSDVLEIDPLLLGEDDGLIEKHEPWSVLESTLKSIPGSPMLITDIILNHVSSSDSWALHCPEATYCLRDCPYLTCAFELDCEIAKLVEEWEKNEKISIHECMHAILLILEKFNFNDFFQLNIPNISIYINSR